MRAYSRMMVNGSFETTRKQSSGSGCVDVIFAVGSFSSKVPNGWWMKRPQPPVPISHWIGKRARGRRVGASRAGGGERVAALPVAHRVDRAAAIELRAALAEREQRRGSGLELQH